MRVWYGKLMVCLLAAVMICTCTAGVWDTSAEEMEEKQQEPLTAAELPEENRLIVCADSDIRDAVDPVASLEVEGGYILSFDTKQECEQAADILSGMDCVESAECDAYISICTETADMEEQSAQNGETVCIQEESESQCVETVGPQEESVLQKEETEVSGDVDAENREQETDLPDESEETVMTEMVPETSETVMPETDPAADETAESGTKETETLQEAILPEQWRKDADSQGKKLVILIDTGSELADASVDLTGNGPADGNGHGTEMNRLILEASGGKAFVVSVKALDDSGTGLVSNLFSAVSLAMQRNADVISLSVSAEDAAQMEGFKSQLQEAAKSGISVVCAAGNNGLEAEKYCPGNIDSAITVGACDSLGVILPRSNYGKAIDCFCSAGSTSEAAALVSGYICSNGYDGLSGHPAVFMPDEVKDPLAFEPGDDQDDGLVHIAADTIKAGDTVKLNGGYNVGPAVSTSDTTYLAEYAFRMNGNPGYCGNISAGYGMYSSASGTRNYVAGVYDFTDVGGKDVNYIVKQVYDKNKNYTYSGKTIDGTLLRKILYYSDGAPGASKFDWASFESGYAENSYVFSDLPGSNRESDPNRGKYTKSNAYRKGVVSAACSYIWGQAMGLCTVNSSTNYKTYVIGKRYVDKVKSMTAAPDAFTAYFAVLSDSYDLNNSMSVVQPVLSWTVRDTEQVRIRKIVSVSNSIIKPANYDMSKYYSPKGLVFAVYNDKECTDLAAKFTIGAADSSGNYYSGWVELKHGGYYLKEIDNSANKNLKISKMTAGFQVEMNDTLYPDGKRTIEVTDVPETGALQIYKRVKDSNGNEVGDLYSAEGTVFALYTAATGGEKLAELTIGQRTSSGIFYSKIVKQIAYGTYYLQEESIPQSLIDAGATIPKERVKCEILPGKLNTSGVLIINFDNIVPNPSLETSALDIRTGSQNALADRKLKITDHVSYDKLVPNRTYVISGTLMDREKKEVLKVNGKAITKEVTFTPTAASGTVDVTFSFVGSSLCGRKLCVFEELRLGGKTVATHKSYTDTKQQIDMSPPGSIELIKYDNDGKKLSGVVFEITDRKGNAVKDINGKTVPQSTTGTDGAARFTDLPYGDYRITEVKTLPGYSLLAEYLDVTLPVTYTEEEAQNGQIDVGGAFYSEKEGMYYITSLQYSVSDSVNLQMPRAGSGKYGGGAAVLLIAAAGIYYSQKQRCLRNACRTE